MLLIIILIEIKNIYELIDGQYFLPVKSTVEYFVKDARFSKWVQKDLKTIMNNSHTLDTRNEMIKGQITILYNENKIYRGLNDAIFN